jgi:hypothetical protein
MIAVIVWKMADSSKSILFIYILYLSIRLHPLLGSTPMDWNEWVFLYLLNELLDRDGPRTSRVEREHAVSQVFGVNDPWVGHHQSRETTVGSSR